MSCRFVSCVAVALGLLAVSATPAFTFQSDKKADGSQIISRRGRPTLVVESPEERREIDQQTGIPVYFHLLMRPAEEEIRDLPRLSTDDARGRALRFLEQSKIRLDGQWVIESAKLIDHGSAGVDYHFRWHKRLEGIYLPAFVDVEVDARTGTIITFRLLDDPVVVPLRWRLSGGDAVATLRRARGGPRWDVQWVKLCVSSGSWGPDEAPGRQALVWNVQLINPAGRSYHDLYACADIDAVTGEIVQVYTYGGAPRADKKARENGKKLLRETPAPREGAALSAPPTLFESAKASK